MIRTNTIFAASALCLGLVSALAWAQSDAPQVKHSGNVSYLSGGVSEEERERLQALARGFNLELEMAQTDRAYVADVNITVTDTRGKQLLRTKSDGPLFYAKLPPGTYHIIATTPEGRTVHKTVTISSHSKRKVDMRWSPEAPAG